MLGILPFLHGRRQGITVIRLAVGRRMVASSAQSGHCKRCNANRHGCLHWREVAGVTCLFTAWPLSDEDGTSPCSWSNDMAWTALCGRAHAGSRFSKRPTLLKTDS